MIVSVYTVFAPTAIESPVLYLKAEIYRICCNIITTFRINIPCGLEFAAVFFCD